MVKPSVREPFGLVHSLVQSHNGRNVAGPKVVKVVLRGMQGVAVLNPASIVGASKSQKFPYGGGGGGGGEGVITY